MTVYIIIRRIPIFPVIDDVSGAAEKALAYSLNNAKQILYSSLGLLAFFITSFYAAGTIDPIRRNNWIVKIGDCCFGVYIFQQFLLQGLYYHTPIPEISGPYILPWVGVIAVLTVSLSLAYIIRLTKVGRSIL